MAKLPYIKFFVGDWLRDTRILSHTAKACWIDILCYMNISKEVGVITHTLADYQRILGCVATDVETVFKELEEKDICDIERLSHDRVKLINRRMVREEKDRLLKVKAGKASAAKRQQQQNKGSTPVEESVVTPVATKQQQNRGNGNGIDSNTEDMGERYGEREKIIELDLHSHSILTLDDLKAAFLFHKLTQQVRETICLNNYIATIEELAEWCDVFNAIQQKKLVTRRGLGEWCDHFGNWLRSTDTTADPKKYFDAKANTESKPTANVAGAGSQSGTIDELQKLKKK